MGYALYTTHERPFFFNQSISTGKNYFRFEVNYSLTPDDWPAFPGGAGYPLGPNERFQIISSSFPRLHLAHPNLTIKVRQTGLSKADAPSAGKLIKPAVSGATKMVCARALEALCCSVRQHCCVGTIYKRQGHTLDHAVLSWPA